MAEHCGALRGELLSGEALRRERSFRSDPDYYLLTLPKRNSIPPGYEVYDDSLKTKRRLRKPKAPGQKLEDRAWCLFYDLGAERICDGEFTLLLRPEDNKTKQCDLVAVRDDIVFYSECKENTSGSPNQRRLGSDALDEIVALRPYLEAALREATGISKPRFAFAIMTDRVPTPRLRADAFNHGCQ